MAGTLFVLFLISIVLFLTLNYKKIFKEEEDIEPMRDIKITTTDSNIVIIVNDKRISHYNTFELQRNGIQIEMIETHPVPRTATKRPTTRKAP